MIKTVCNVPHIMEDVKNVNKVFIEQPELVSNVLIKIVGIVLRVI
jgi:hypothetical protein